MSAPITPQTGDAAGRPQGQQRLYSAALAVCALLALPASADDRLQEFWNGCMAEAAVPNVDASFRVRRFGRNAETANMLIGLIAAGKKTGTFTSPWLYEGDPGQEPVIGGYSVVTDLSGTPRLILRTIALRTKAFEEITEADTRIDGPAVRELEVWRRVHWAYFERVLAPLGKKPVPEMPVTVEAFEVVCGP